MYIKVVYCYWASLAHLLKSRLYSSLTCPLLSFSVLLYFLFMDFLPVSPFQILCHLFVLLIRAFHDPYAQCARMPGGLTLLCAIQRQSSRPKMHFSVMHRTQGNSKY